MTELLEKEITLDKSALKDFAIKARRKLKERVELQAKLMGFYEDNRAVNYEFEDDRQVKINGEFFSKKQVETLQREIKSKGYENLIDEVAYTWFNRFIALYYMEVNGYSENNFNIISNIDNLNQFAVSVSSQLNDEEKQTVISAVQNNNQDVIFKTLLIHQCNVMNKKLPFLFEQIQDYTELLFPQGMNSSDSVINEMLSLDKSNWQVVEIIGWLYQYYIAERKDEVFADLKNGKKISKENIPAATQIFTPKWIVKYMVENSVGKMWLEARPNEELQSKFKYYLESAEQEYNVKEKLKEIINKNISPEDIKVLDPACGSGHILVTAFEVLYQIYKSAGYMEDEIAKLILTKNLYGLDICDRASQLAQLAVIMKAREYDKDISSKVVELNITSIQDTNWFDSRVKECLMNGVTNQLLAQAQIDLLQKTFKDAKEYGSILDVKEFDFNFWEERLYAVQTLNMGLLYSDITEQLRDKLPQLIKQARIMQQQYECVISNPPYMGNKGMSSKLSEYVKKNYKTTKTDFFAVFMEKNYHYTKKNGYTSMITQPSWLFLSSFEDLRTQILDNQNITSLLHMGRGIFGIDFGSCAFTFRKANLKNYNGSYFRLHQRTFQYINPEDIANLYLTAKQNHDFVFDFSSYKANADENDKEEFENSKPLKIYYEAKQTDFHSIPGSPIAYWASDRVREIYANELPISKIATPCAGLQTSNNNRFLRLWHEVDIHKVEMFAKDTEEAIQSNAKWFPYNKGGDFRKWYGNNEYFVNYHNDGYEIKELVKAKYRDTSYAKDFTSERWDKLIEVWVVKNQKYYFKEGITWSFISSTNFGVRYSRAGFIFDVGGSSLFPRHEQIFYLTGFLCSKLTYEFLKLLNPTLNFQVGNVGSLPIIFPKDENIKKQIDSIVEQNIQISKDDWDSFETSWDFEQHPLLRFKENGKVENSFNKWKEYKQEQFNKLKANEEELNRLFIEIYGLQDEMTPDVDDKDITVALADELRDIKSLLSYAVGCMFGRYSLDEKGLIYAGGEFDKSRYQTLEVDEDGILPILSDTWFDDDIIEEFKRFLKKAFGELYFNENMQYIADVLGRKGSESAEDRIRTYFLKDFYKDHLQIYKKRPIYWMFTSGKEKAFNALIYLHRYDKTTLSRIRKDYLHEFQNKLDNAIQRAENEGNVKLTSLYSKYQTECLEFDRKIKDLADEQIELDLDDGVKVNYAKFQGLLEAEKDIVGKDKK